MMIHQDQATNLHLKAGHHGLVTDDSDRAAWLSGARSYLRDADPVLARLIDDRPDSDPRGISELPAMDLFGAPELLGAEPDQLRAAGLSWRKISALRDLAGRTGVLPAGGA